MFVLTTLIQIDTEKEWQVLQRGLGNGQSSKKRRINKVKAADKEGAEKAAKTVKGISMTLTLGTEIIGKVP